MTQAYYFQNKKCSKDKQFDWNILILEDSTNVPERTKRHKGAYDYRYECSRPATENEIAVKNQAAITRTRVTFYKYKNWQDLIEDETETLGAGHPFLEILENLKQKYKSIPLLREQKGQLKKQL